MALSPCCTELDENGRELNAHGTAAFPIACYHDQLEIDPVPWHWHEELEVLVVTEGTVLAAAGGEKCALPVGDGIFINAGVLHADWPASAVPCGLRSMVFHPRLVGGSADSVFWQKYLQPLLTDPTRPCAVLHRRSRGSGRRWRRWSGPTAPSSMRCRAMSSRRGQPCQR